MDVVAPLVHFGNVRGDLGQYVHYGGRQGSKGAVAREA